MEHRITVLETNQEHFAKTQEVHTVKLDELTASTIRMTTAVETMVEKHSEVLTELGKQGKRIGVVEKFKNGATVAYLIIAGVAAVAWKGITYFFT